MSARIAFKENEAKLAAGYNFTKGDQRFEMGTIIKLVAVAFGAAFAAGFAGIGPGTIYNSILV